jgi:DNA-nicking Smr family endonuclease
MDFGRILDDWERMKRGRGDSSPPLARKGAVADASSPDAAARGALEAWLAEHDVGDKDAESGEAAGDAERSREARRLAALKPEAALDLHGMTGEEAESAIAVFLDSSSRMGLEKVLLIHGKGLHSAGMPVLKKAARRALEAHPLAGRFGEADRTDGGSGALWVLIRKKG